MAVDVLAAMTILIVGESHLAYPNYLIDPLVDDLTKQGAIVHALGGCAAGADSWVKPTNVSCAGDRRSNKPGTFTLRPSMTTPLKDLIAADKPDLIMVVIGDATAAYEGDAFPKVWAWQTVTSLTKVIAASKTTCVWVGPPWGDDGGKFNKNNKRVEVVTKFLAQNVSPCKFIDSLTFSKPGQWRTVDGTHLTATGYKAWSALITNAVVNLPEVKKLKKP